MTINKGGLFSNIFRGIKSSVLDKLNELAFEKFERAKAYLLHNLRNHPVSQELSAGQSISSSRFISGPGNLYSFLGFEAGTNPVQDLITLLDDIIVFEPVTRLLDRRNLQFSATGRTYIPTDTDLSVLNLSWEPNISWVTAIENGVSNLGHYLFVTSAASRSGKGIQVDKITRSASFSPVPYLTPLLEQFRRDLQ